ncbi:response regulator [Mariniblastus fucicola]|uniref:Transcriptional regulatory protein YycF n=1 Tax=Mariniblastus fucicola TaxID=980251 RepID=A0A5B9P877_9BACT|nr:response regulator [Mariniblastus fucicola]QEG22498.1 Transcriptional regulatory protein YycF [Mariniblastus fucicola]
METNIATEELPTRNKYAAAEIFVIDDEQLVVDTLTYFLRSAGFENVHGFCDSSEAISQIRFTRPDVVFTDIRMPGLDGNMITKMVRSFPHLYSVPIIAITADPNFDVSKSIISAGAESVLIKPVSREILIQRAVQAIDNAISKEATYDKPDVEYLVSEEEAKTMSIRPQAYRDESAVERRIRRRSRFRE